MTAPLYLKIKELAVVKDGPGDLCVLSKLLRPAGESATGTPQIIIIRGGIGIRLRANTRQFDLIPLAKELDAMIVAAMAKAEAAAKEKEMIKTGTPASEK